VADQYPEGARVTVYYNPQSPHRAVLEPRGSALYIILLVMGGHSPLSVLPPFAVPFLGPGVH
jgi:hypothetical protein